MGKKRQPVYKVVAADSRSPRDGKFIESIGLYNPKTDPATVDLKEDRALYWLNVGAQPTDTVKNLFTDKGIMLKKELMSKGLTEEQIVAKLDEWQKLKEANLAALTKKKAEKASAKKETAEKVEDKKESSPEAQGTAFGIANPV